MKNPDEAIEQYQLAKKDREYLERIRHIGEHMPGLLTCDDGTVWHPVELLALVDEVGVLNKQLEAANALIRTYRGSNDALFQMQEAAKDLTKRLEFQKKAWAADLAERDALQADNARLRESLQDAHEYIGDCAESYDTATRRIAALAATPAQSLARIRNQVREACAKLAEKHDSYVLAEEIRAMKEPE